MKSLTPMPGSKNILVTGGFGNLGAWVCWHLIQNNWQVTILGRSHGDIQFTGPYTFIECDITNESDCVYKLNSHEFTYVIHLASANEVNTPGYNKLATDVNVMGTANLLNALNRKKLLNFIYFSTIHVYDSNCLQVDENSLINPVNDYALTHYQAEKHVEAFHQKYTLPYSILRLSNSYGCPKTINTTKWYLALNDMARTAFEKEKIILKTNGKISRDFIWMGDVCNITEALLTKEEAPCTVFNLSSGQSVTILELANEIKNAYTEFSGKTIPIEVNSDDKSVYETKTILNNKLKSVIPFHLHNKIKDEAKAIFKLLQAN